jgi:amino acid transporter
MGGFSNFAISFSIISILTGAVTLYGYGLEMGGPLEMTLGWPLATLFTLTVAASMAELCSAYPTAGAMYHWAADLGGPGAGWFVAWLNIFGLIAAQAGINYSCAQFILPFLGVASTPRTLLLMFAFILVTQGFEPLRSEAGLDPERFQRDRAHRRCRGSRRRAILSGSKAAGQLFVPGHQQQWPFVLLVGLRAGPSSSPVDLHRFRCSAHMAEETEDPRRHAPWGIVLSVAVSGVVGYLLLIALTLAIRDIPGVLAAKDAAGNPIPAVIAILDTALEPKGNAMAALASMAMWFCGLRMHHFGIARFFSGAG